MRRLACLIPGSGLMIDRRTGLLIDLSGPASSRRMDVSAWLVELWEQAQYGV